MIESARDEALLREAGFLFEDGWTPHEVSKADCMRLIALARQRSGWKWVPEEPTKEIEYAWHNGPTSTHQRFRERWRNALAAASQPDPLTKPEES